MNFPNGLSRRLFSLSHHRHYFIRRTLKSSSISPLYNLNQNVVSANTSTLNESELAHFGSLSSKWWTGPEFGPLRTLNSLRVPFITNAFQSKLSPTDEFNEGNKQSVPQDGVKLLDIGSGGGILSEALARLGATVTGIDPVEENVSVASMHSRVIFRATPERMPQYKSCTIEQLSADQANLGSFDGIVVSEVLEHVDNIGHFLKCTLDCLRPGGFFFLTTINQSALAYLSVICAGEDILGLVPKGTHQYDKFVPPKALSLVLNDFKCDVVQVHGMLFNPLTMQWSWTQNQLVNYALMAVKRDH